MPIRCQRPRAFVAVCARPLARNLSSSSMACSQSKEISVVEHKESAALSPRWLSDLKVRIGKCVSFGLRPYQVERAGEVLRIVARDWRDLVAGSEGFLTGKGRAGVEGHRVVWGEMDSMHHINNVTYTRYAETARVEWARNFGVYIDPEHKKMWTELLTPRGDGLILRSIRTDYKFPMTWPDRISVYHKLRSAPSHKMDSFTLDVIIFSHKQQRAAARCEEDIVVYDYERNKKTPLQPFMVDVFSETFRLQEEAKRTNTKRVLNLLREIERLEKESWDRTDAQEDFGNAR